VFKNLFVFQKIFGIKMFCLIFLPYIGENRIPNVLEISQSKSALLQRMEDKAIQRCIDEVGRKNYVNTLDEKGDLTTLIYPVYPNFALQRKEDSVTVHRVEKKQVVVKGYLYNSTQDVVEVSNLGAYYVLPVEHWKYEELPKRPEEDRQKIVKPIEKKSEDMLRNYDKVLLQLIESIQKRKIE
jgi:hypothetical protein